MADLIGGVGIWQKYKAQEKLQQSYFDWMEEMNQPDVFERFLMGQLGQGVEPYRGKLAAPASPLQTGAFEAIAGMGESPNAQFRLARANELAAGVPAYDVSAEDYARMYEEGVRAPAMREFQEETIPYLMHTYGSRSGMSGELLDQLANAGVDLTTNLAAQRAEIMLRGEERRQTALETAADRSLTALPIAATEETRPIRYGLVGGEIQRGIEQDALTGKFYKWMMAQPWANPWFSLLQGGGATAGISVPGFSGQSGTGAGLSGIGQLLQ